RNGLAIFSMGLVPSFAAPTTIARTKSVVRVPPAPVTVSVEATGRARKLTLRRPITSPARSSACSAVGVALVWRISTGACGGAQRSRAATRGTGDGGGSPAAALRARDDSRARDRAAAADTRKSYRPPL